MTDSQKEGPSDESSAGSDMIAEEPKETTDEKKLAELIESVNSDDAYDEEQIEQEEPLEDELRPLERQEVPLEMIERQPLEQKQSLETLEEQQPIEEQPMQISDIQQLSPSQQQPPEQQLITEQQVPESPAGKQQQEEKRSINQVQEHHGNGGNMAFVLPFDSQDVISAN